MCAEISKLHRVGSVRNGPVTCLGPRRKLPCGSVVRGSYHSRWPSLPTHSWSRDIRVSTYLYRPEDASRIFDATTAMIPPVRAPVAITRIGVRDAMRFVVEDEDPTRARATRKVKTRNVAKTIEANSTSVYPILSRTRGATTQSSNTVSRQKGFDRSDVMRRTVRRGATPSQRGS